MKHREDSCPQCPPSAVSILFSAFTFTFTFTFTFMHLADAFIQSDLHCIQAIHFLSVCVPWELNPQPFALLTQCSTTEPFTVGQNEMT